MRHGGKQQLHNFGIRMGACKTQDHTCMHVEKPQLFMYETCHACDTHECKMHLTCSMQHSWDMRATFMWHACNIPVTCATVKHWPYKPQEWSGMPATPWNEKKFGQARTFCRSLSVLVMACMHEGFSLQYISWLRVEIWQHTDRIEHKEPNMDHWQIFTANISKGQLSEQNGFQSKIHRNTFWNCARLRFFAPVLRIFCARFADQVLPENSENARASKFKLRKKLLCMNLIKTSLSAVLHCAAELHQVLPQLPPAGQKQIFLMQSCQLSGTTVFDDLYEKKKCGQLRVIPGVIQHHVSEKFSVGSLEAKPLLLPAVLKYHKSSRKICMTKYISKNFNTCMVNKMKATRWHHVAIYGPKPPRPAHKTKTKFTAEVVKTFSSTVLEQNLLTWEPKMARIMHEWVWGTEMPMP